MPTIQVTGLDLFRAVEQLPPAEYEKFIERALSKRGPRSAVKLSAKETLLIAKINKGLPESLRSRYGVLERKRKKRALTESEHKELLELSQESENRDVERAAALVELAKIRGVPVRSLMKQLGIKAGHG